MLILTGLNLIERDVMLLAQARVIWLVPWGPVKVTIGRMQRCELDLPLFGYDRIIEVACGAKHSLDFRCRGRKTGFRQRRNRHC